MNRTETIQDLADRIRAVRQYASAQMHASYRSKNAALANRWLKVIRMCQGKGTETKA